MDPAFPFCEPRAPGAVAMIEPSDPSDRAGIDGFEKLCQDAGREEAELGHAGLAGERRNSAWPTAPTCRLAEASDASLGRSPPQPHLPGPPIAPPEAARCKTRLLVPETRPKPGLLRGALSDTLRRRWNFLPSFPSWPPWQRSNMASRVARGSRAPVRGAGRTAYFVRVPTPDIVGYVMPTFEVKDSAGFRASMNDLGNRTMPLLNSSGVWMLTIRNVGDASATNVRVLIPGAIFSSVRKQGGQIQWNRVESERVSLGDLMPRAAVSVNVWLGPSRRLQDKCPPDRRHPDASPKTIWRSSLTMPRS